MTYQRIVLVLLLCRIAGCEEKSTASPTEASQRPGTGPISDSETTPKSNGAVTSAMASSREVPEASKTTPKSLRPQIGPICAKNKQLVNTVVYEGNSTSFFNLIDPNSVKWEIDPSFGASCKRKPPYTIADGNSVQPPFIGAYNVNSTQLNISKASIYTQASDPFSTSGLYTLTYKTDKCVTMASLIVISQGPLCYCNAADSDNAVLTCAVYYGVSRVLSSTVSITWSYESDVGYRPIDDPIPNRDSELYDLSMSTYSITSSGAASYTCVVTFSAPDYGVLNMATDPPSLKATCTIDNCVKKPASTTTTKKPSPIPKFGPVCAPDKQLKNTVVYEGNSTTFFNLNDPGNVKWEIFPSFGARSPCKPTLSSYTIAEGNSVQSPFIGVYNVTSNKLNISKASIYPQSTDPYSTAGLYILTYKTDKCVSMANLIVIYQGPVCQCTDIDSHNARLSCKLYYGVSRILPNILTMMWTSASEGVSGPIGSPFPNQDSELYDVSTFTTVVTINDDPSYTCDVIFNPPDSVFDSYNLADNAPLFGASCKIENCVHPANKNKETKKKSP